MADAVTGERDGHLSSEPYAKVDRDLNADAAESVDGGEISVRADSRKLWKRNKVWPIPVLSQLYSNEKLVEDIVYITDCRDFSRFDPPRTYEELRSPGYAYFAGVAAGDGGFEGGPACWGITDGGSPEQLEDSKNFIRKMSSLIGRLFGIPESSRGIRERGNKVSLQVSNKWFGRFVQSVFDFPESYKKGNLKRPDVFESEKNRCYFWRGVFDADGAVPRDSYRISLSSATQNFLEQCRADLEEIGIDVAELRKPAAYLLRVSPESFAQFSTKIGFSHPRKKRILLGKLREGARNYIYGGRREENISCETFYDFTAIDNLRVKGVGDHLKRDRENCGLYQRELAKTLGASQNQVYYWENEIYAMPLELFARMFESKKQVLDLLSKEEPLFKVGVRGRESNLVELPSEHDSRIDEIAANSVVSGKEMRIRRKDEEIAMLLEKIFNTNIERGERKFRVRNGAVVEFFKTFYRYVPKFPAYKGQELQQLARKLEIPG